MDEVAIAAYALGAELLTGSEELPMPGWFAFPLALWSTIAQAPSAPSVDVAMRFLSLVEQRDWAAATSMITAEAVFGIGDIGGPLNAETMPATGSFLRPSCRMTDIAETDMRMPEHPRTRFVEAHWDCTYPDAPGTRRMTITVFVQGERIAGLYVD